MRRLSHHQLTMLTLWQHETNILESFHYSWLILANMIPPQFSKDSVTLRRSEVLLTSLCLSDLGKLNIVNGAVSTGAFMVKTSKIHAAKIWHVNEETWGDRQKLSDLAKQMEYKWDMTCKIRSNMGPVAPKKKKLLRTRCFRCGGALHGGVRDVQPGKRGPCCFSGEKGYFLGKHGKTHQKRSNLWRKWWTLMKPRD